MTDDGDDSDRVRALTATLGGGLLAIGVSSGSEHQPMSDDRRDEFRVDEPVLVTVNDYRPGMTFRVVERLPATITVQLLRLPSGETVPVLTRPDEYVGYVVRSDFGDRQVDTTVLVFSKGSLDVDARYGFATDAQVFSDRLSLFRTSVWKHE